MNVSERVPPVPSAVALSATDTLGRGASLAEYTPVAVVVAPAVTVTVWHTGRTRCGTDPKHTSWAPTGRSVAMPTSSRATPST